MSAGGNMRGKPGMLSRHIVTALLLGLFAFSTAWPGRAEEPRAKLKVVATFSILGDLTRNVGGERIDLVTLVGPDGDGHVYSPAPADARRVADAKVVITNGLKFEGWIDRLVKSSGTKASVVQAATGVRPLAASGGGHHHGGDPHAWQNIANVKIYVSNIRDALIKADPDGRSTYEANAMEYIAKLDELEAEVKSAVAKIPPERRKIITSHDAFGYFENAYGIDFIAPQGVSTESEASAKDVAKIIQQVRREGIRAIFVENISDPRLVGQIGKEAGAKIGDKLYSDALSGPEGLAPTYIEMMRHNIKAISTALSS